MDSFRIALILTLEIKVPFQKQFQMLRINKISLNNLTVQKADKGNILVIDSKDNITNKTLQFLADLNFIELESDLASRFQNEIKNSIKKSNLFLSSTQIHTFVN